MVVEVVVVAAEGVQAMVVPLVLQRRNPTSSLL